ncbi:MAG: hypothetical protein Q4F21_01535 [Lachnospiraceae bacterium]|nr:hypothetical protein [Lachnospiraceae bacterium]
MSSKWGRRWIEVKQGRWWVEVKWGRRWIEVKQGRWWIEVKWKMGPMVG